jgi:uracil-DNA glycosylase family 4
VIACRRCERLVEHCTNIAEVKRRAYRDWTYWGKPVPGFGDPKARVLIVGLAPGAHGANRTGRIFTGDSSGDFLYSALYVAGFANQPTSRSIDDGLQLIDAYITASARCAPPGNKLTPQEVAACRPFLTREIGLLPNVRVVVCLGKLAFDNYLGILKSEGLIRSRAEYTFAHNAEFGLPGGAPTLIASYHPSQQNTSTGKLTESMFLDVFRRARALLD